MEQALHVLVPPAGRGRSVVRARGRSASRAAGVLARRVLQRVPAAQEQALQVLQQLRVDDEVQRRDVRPNRVVRAVPEGRELVLPSRGDPLAHAAGRVQPRQRGGPARVRHRD